MLLYFEADDVFRSPTIMKVLGGDFSEQSSAEANQDAEFFQAIFEDLPGPALYANGQLRIEGLNRAALLIFGGDVMGEDIGEFFTSDKFLGDKKKLFTGTHNKVTQKLVYTNKWHLEVTRVSVMGKFIVLCDDITENAKFDAQIKDERARIAGLLGEFMPPMLVDRMSTDDTPISFSVPLATVLLLNFEAFSKWAITVDASVALGTLDRVFQQFDALLSSKPGLTKIKSVTDEYLVADGIFSDAAKAVSSELVAFGVEAIQIVEELNAADGLNLKLRGGASYGGPLLAGVLGVSKPAFEIFGKPVAQAKQMEEIARPRSIQVSRPVYEQIFGDRRFVACEYAKEIRGEMVISYTVTKPK
jgi:class 3 adenylate cyclase